MIHFELKATMRAETNGRVELGNGKQNLPKIVKPPAKYYCFLRSPHEPTSAVLRMNHVLVVHLLNTRNGDDLF